MHFSALWHATTVKSVQKSVTQVVFALAYEAGTDFVMKGVFFRLALQARFSEHIFRPIPIVSFMVGCDPLDLVHLRMVSDVSAEKIDRLSQMFIGEQVSSFESARPELGMFGGAIVAHAPRAYLGLHGVSQECVPDGPLPILISASGLTAKGDEAVTLLTARDLQCTFDQERICKVSENNLALRLLAA